ncbi:glyoxalase [Burkholderia stabilis]|uniref:Glyoxalase n=1 Tax=Burkholderia stabilis TaxID=95485 RepID=A0A1Y1BUG0_9BURK|nr:glyoxalase [Burkholderia stabilis]
MACADAGGRLRRRSRFFVAPASLATPPKPAARLAPALAAGLRYDTAHVYVVPEDFDRFTDSFVATFRGGKSKQGVDQVTPSPSQTLSRLFFTPSGTISEFVFKTPIPGPFGSERTGYLVTDRDTSIPGLARCRSVARNARSSMDRISNPQTLWWSVRHTCLHAPIRERPGNRIRNLSSHPCDLSTSAAPNPCPDSPQRGAPEACI